MIFYILGPLGFFFHLICFVCVFCALRLERYALWAAILLAIFTEIGAVVAFVQAIIYLSQGKTWDGGKAST